MLLGATDNKSHQRNSNNEDFICNLMNSNRYAEAYELLKAEPAEQTTTQFNLALCHFWVENYREALICLDRAQMLLPAGDVKPNLNTDSFYKAIRNKQNQLNDHQQPINQKQVRLLVVTVADAIVRLKIDCWLQFKEYARVIDTATPIAYKNYQNITEALNTAQKNI